MIEITNLIWLDESIEKIETKHDVTPAEVLESSPKIKRMSKGHFRGEHVYRALGQTEEGRYLAVFFIYKRTHEALVLSARDMDEKERKGYGRK
jgi:uncharacterized protein